VKEIALVKTGVTLTVTFAIAQNAVVCKSTFMGDYVSNFYCDEKEKEDSRI
jgi:hypothetical protein